MTTASNTRLIARRTIQAVATVAVAAVSAVGIARANVAPGARVARSVTSSTKYLSAAVKHEPAPAPMTSSVGLDLPNLNHARVDGWIKRFTTDQRSSYVTQLGRKGKYERMISAKLARKKMPQDLIYLAMIESGFNPTAKSPVKAAGLWQFMGPTAKQYGLKVTRKVDERTNPTRSTDAALTYLSSLHRRLGSWYLAAAAYNSGEGTVLRALKKVTGQTRGTDEDYYRIAHALPQETRDYVPKMIAAARIGNAPKRYGFTD